MAKKRKQEPLAKDVQGDIDQIKRGVNQLERNLIDDGYIIGSNGKKK